MTEWNKDRIVELLAKNDKAVGRAFAKVLKENGIDAYFGSRLD
jgi:hypothetical protein